MIGEWEEFTHKTNYRTEMLRVSLNGRGQFMLNRKAVAELGDPEAVVLFYDRNSRLIGLRGSPADVEHAYGLKTQSSSQNYQIKASSFCNYYNINVGDTIVFNDVKIEDGMIVLSLDKVSEVVRRARFADLPARLPEPAPKARQAPKFSTLLRMRTIDGD